MDSPLRDARKAKGLTQRQLADAAGVDQGTVSRWERRLISPSDNRKIHVAKIVDRDPRDLFPLKAA